MHTASGQSSKKREQFANSIRSAQRKEIFNAQRKRLEEARRREDDKEVAKAEMQLRVMFQNHNDEYQMVMAMADKLEQEERDYEAYLARLQEDSVCYEMAMKRKEIEQIKKQMLEMLEQESMM